MDEQELGMILGRIEAGVKANGDRLDHQLLEINKIDEKVIEAAKQIAVIKAKVAVIAVVISFGIGVVGLIIRVWK